MKRYLLPFLVVGLVFAGTNYLFSQQSGGPGSGQIVATSVSSAAFPLLAPDGTVAAPSYSFTNETTAGLYRGGTGVLGLGTGFSRITLGGATASFPAIKRNGAALNFRLADDSGDANITTGTITVSGSIVLGTNTLASNSGGTVANIMLGRLVANQIELQADNNRFNLTNTASTIGAMIDTSTDGTVSILTRGAANTAILKSAQLQVNGTVVVGSLPACNAGAEGSHRAVSDASTTYTAGIGTAVVGGGANHVPVYCDGTSWKIG